MILRTASFFPNRVQPRFPEEYALYGTHFRCQRLNSEGVLHLHNEHGTVENPLQSPPVSVSGETVQTPFLRHEIHVHVPPLAHNPLKAFKRFSLLQTCATKSIRFLRIHQYTKPARLLQRIL